MVEVVGMQKQWGCKGIAGRVHMHSIVGDSPNFGCRSVFL